MKRKNKNIILYMGLLILVCIGIIYGVGNLSITEKGIDFDRGIVGDTRPDDGDLDPIIDFDCFWCDDGNIEFATYTNINHPDGCPEGTSPTRPDDCSETLVTCYWCDNGETLSSTFYDECPVGRTLEPEYCPPRLVTCNWCDNGVEQTSTFENECPDGKYSYALDCSSDNFAEPSPFFEFIKTYGLTIIVVANVLTLLIVFFKKTED